MRMIEQTLIMPMTILIIAALITLMMNFYSDLSAQIEQHREEIKEIYKVSETVEIRAWDRLCYEKKN